MKFKNIHPWNLSPKKAIALQNRLKKKIRLEKYRAMTKLIAAADVAFKNRKATAAVIVVSFPDLKLVECISKTARVSYPYIPGLLTFREGPVLKDCFELIRSEPDVIIFDGQGIAHPRKMGIAAHLGILLDRPSIGCAKTRLFGNYKEPKKSRGSFSYILDSRKRKIGAVLRTKDNVSPVFVSPGHRIDIGNSVKIILSCTGKYRLPEPLRLAHRLSN